MSSPAITLMVQYTEPNTGFVKYMNREGAVSFSQELALVNEQTQFEDIQEERLKAILEAIPEQGLDFASYIGYMNRSYATESQDEAYTAIFTQETNYLKEADVEGLKNQLERAYHNQSLLWQAVFSFDNDFLAKEGLYNVETGEVDQQALKQAVRETMPGLIKKEGLSEDAFWWGNIHVNTDNIHIHVGLSEINSSRPMVYYEPRQRWERKGNFSQKTIKNAKSDFYHALINPHTKERLLRREKLIARLRTDLLSQALSDQQADYSRFEKLYLEQAYRFLPQGKNLRYGSNAKDFAVSKFFLDRYIDSYLSHRGSELYSPLEEEIRAFLSEYQGVYDATEVGRAYEKLRHRNQEAIRSQAQTRGSQLDKQVEARLKNLRESLGNRILKELNSLDRLPLSEQESNLAHFSEKNQERILEQLPTASHLKQIEAWQRAGYDLNEGVRPIEVLVPIFEQDRHGKKQRVGFETAYYYDISQVTLDIHRKQASLLDLQELSKDQLEELIDTLQENLDDDDLARRQEIGIYKYALRLKVLDIRDQELVERQAMLEKVDSRIPANKAFQNHQLAFIQQERAFIALSKLPSWSVSEAQKKERDALRPSFIDPVQVSIRRTSPEFVAQKRALLVREMELARPVTDPTLFEVLGDLGMDKKRYLDIKRAEIGVLDTKVAIYQNNQLLDMDPENKELKVENAKHFVHLKKLYQLLSPDGEETTPRQRHYCQLEEEAFSLGQPESGDRPYRPAISPQFLNDLTSSLRMMSRSNREQMRSHMAKVRADEREEREKERSI